MIQVRIVSGAAAADRERPGPELATVVEGASLRVQACGSLRRWSGAGGSQCVLVGEVAGLSDLARLESVSGRDGVEGRFVVIIVSAAGACEVWSDRFGTVDLYYCANAEGVVIATSLDLLPDIARASTDAVGVATALTIYGSRPAKQHTMYAGVRRLGVDEGARVAAGRLETIAKPFVPRSTAAYGPEQLDEYADTLLEAVRARGSQHGNVVYLSSGWDSTSLLACLVHLFGPSRVRAVTARLRFSNRRGIINQFEIDRATAVAQFFGIRLDIVDFDYRSGAHELMERVQPLFRTQQFFSVTGLSWLQLAEHVAKTTSGDEVIFAGEMSDGAHNLGFSQFVTMFHPVQDFREYADKMASYLFGPTFLASLQKGEHGSDLIWKLFRERAGQGIFDEPAQGDEPRRRQLLASFFLRAHRMPLWSLRNTRMLTEGGRSRFGEEMERTYLARAAREVTPATLYAWYLHLYNSFHWQASTVAPLAYTAEWNGLRCVLPFHDGRLQDFLSAMPESWGRGLDLKPTKYPLKWMLEHRVRYPMHLQVGPHSYIYDVEPGFTLMGELLYDSDLGALFKERLRSNVFERWLDPSMFDMAYVRTIVDRYLGGTEVSGAEMTDVLQLAQLAAVGLYGGD